MAGLCTLEATGHSHREPGPWREELASGGGRQPPAHGSCAPGGPPQGQVAAGLLGPLLGQKLRPGWLAAVGSGAGWPGLEPWIDPSVPGPRHLSKASPSPQQALSGGFCPRACGTAAFIRSQPSFWWRMILRRWSGCLGKHQPRCYLGGSAHQPWCSD